MNDNDTETGRRITGKEHISPGPDQLPQQYSSAVKIEYGTNCTEEQRNGRSVGRRSGVPGEKGMNFVCSGKSKSSSLLDDMIPPGNENPTQTTRTRMMMMDSQSVSRLQVRRGDLKGT